MRKRRITKIMCTLLAAASVLSVSALPACKTKWTGVTEKDQTVESVTSNGGFVVQTGDYVYFINGKSTNTADNTFGSVVKGSVQRIKKSDLQDRNYSSTQTVVPSIAYSGQYNAGIYIYGGYIYYSTPTTDKNINGEVLNTNLDFKRTKADGTDTTNGYIWQCANNGVDYRFVEVDGTVYILYAMGGETLFGEDSGVTNIHSVNCTTGEDTLLAYNVSKYMFDTEDPENPYAYYTMNVYSNIANLSYAENYNQLYRVRADAAKDSKSYDFSAISDYDASKNPVYVNLGYHVFDGIGMVDYEKYGINQFNYGAGSNVTYTNLINSGYKYDLQSYKNGTLYYTRTAGPTTQSSLFTVTNQTLGTEAGVKSDWNAITKNAEQSAFIRGGDTTEYTYVTIGGKLYAINAASDGITRQEVLDGELSKEVVYMSYDASAKILFSTKTGESDKYIYYTYSDGLYRLAIDGAAEKYSEYRPNEEVKTDYSGIKILNIYADASWYKPEFVGSTLLFASEIGNMSSYDYIVACDLSGSGADGTMTNSEIKALNDMYTAVNDKIGKYGEEVNSDGSASYENLSDALKYLFCTRDSAYLEELIQAYVDVEGKDREYKFTEQSVKIFNDYASSSGDWEKDDKDVAYKTKKVNGEDVSAIFADYYYALVGKMSEEDKKALLKDYREDYMPEYPVDNDTWWTKLGKGGQAGFIVGMVAGGLLVIASVVLGTLAALKRKQNVPEDDGKKRSDVVIEDDKSINVYEEQEVKNS